MTLALRRFHLDGIGPPGARFDPLMVDLTAVDGDRAAHTALLFLENGGGKSVLLRLLFAVVLPGRRSTIGGARLDGYVGSGDTGHVALEWEGPDGRPLITATVLEWRNRTRSATTANLLQSWYSFVPSPGTLELDSLPWREQGRRVTRNGVRERLAALARHHPELEVVIEDGPTAWAHHLQQATPLDPEMFRYQRQMNADEADAESLFAGVRDDDDFVRFIIEAIHDPDELGEFGELVAGYATQLAQREHLEVERTFCERAAATLRPLGTAAVALREAEAGAARATVEAAALRQGLDARARREEEAASVAIEAAEAATAAASDCDRRSKRVGDIASELKRIEAELRLGEAMEAEESALQALEAARLDATAWRTVGTVLEVNDLTSRRGALRLAQEVAERDLQPLREAAEQAASTYAGRLVEIIATLDQEAAVADAEAKAEDEQAAQIHQNADRAREAAGAADATAAAWRLRVDEVAALVKSHRHAGTIKSGEDPRHARERIVEEAGAAAEQLTQLRSHRRELASHAEVLGEDLVRWGGEEARADAAADAARRELDAARTLAAGILAHPRTQQIAAGAEDAWTVTDLLHDTLETHVRAQERSLRQSRTRRDEVAASLEALAANGLLPAPEDVQRVRDTLADAGIPATTGWSYLAHNLDPDGRRRALESNPAAAGGVLVTDPSRLDAARQILADAAVESDHIVLVATAAQLDEVVTGHAAPVRPALYDPDWTERTRQELEDQIAALTEEMTELTNGIADDEPLLNQVRHLRSTCPTERRAHLIEHLTEAEATARHARSALTTAATTRAATLRQLEEVTTRESTLTTEATEAAERARSVIALVEQLDRADVWRDQARAADEEALGRRAEAQALGAEAAQHQRGAETARRLGTARRRDITAIRQELDAMGVEPSPAPPEEATDSLRATAHAARQVYETERAGRDLTPEIEAIEAQLEASTGRLSPIDPTITERARALAATAAGLDGSSRQARIADAEAAASQVEQHHRDRTSERGRAEQTLESRTPADRARHAVLEGDDVPPDAATAARWAAARQVEFIDLTRQLRSHQAEATRQRDVAQGARTQARLVATAITVLPPGEAPEGGDSFAPWEGTVDDAAEVANRARHHLDEQRAEVTAQERAVERAGHHVRTLATDATLATVGGVRLALAEEDLDSLAARAVSLADELDGMRRSIDAELADVIRHREGIVVRLCTLADTHLRYLGRMEKLSALPSGLGEWSGRPFVTVSFTAADPAELPVRLAPVVDAAAHDPRRREPVRLLLEAMRAAVACPEGDGERTFRVRLLRPNRTMQVQWATVAELEREFSGGMKLTTAICTYCTLAALRAHTRATGQLLGQSPGPLFLDNPLGKASADYLLDLQNAIATKLGVQLVHTTGVWDIEALATYERVVRLRNLADVRRNVHHLQVDDLPPLLPTSATGVDATGFSVRRAP